MSHQQAGQYRSGDVQCRAPGTSAKLMDQRHENDERHIEEHGNADQQGACTERPTGSQFTAMAQQAIGDRANATRMFEQRTEHSLQAAPHR